MALASALLVVSCVGSDDDTTNVTNVSTTNTTTPSDSSGGEETVTTASTTMPAGTSEGTTGEQCPADAACQDDSQCGAGMCIACSCVGGMDSSGGGDCPPDEMCVMTGAGGMACLAEPDHCTLACNDTMVCPDSMTCQNGACQYDVSMPPPMGDPNYPLPPCPDGFLAVSFGPGDMMYAVCTPECEGTGQDAMCPQGATGTALGACLFNPDSSGMMCTG